MSTNHGAAHLGAPLKAPAALTPEAQPDCARSTNSRLWLWFVAAFLLQTAVWTTWLVIASRNKVEEVPLATAR